MKKRSSPDPIRAFGFSVDVALGPIRANIVAMNEMMTHSDLNDRAIADSLGFLLSDTCVRIERLVEAHEIALATDRREVAA